MVVAKVEPNGHEVEKFESGTSNALDIATTRVAQEVQAAIAVAQRFPRDQHKAYASIMTACQRPSLAEVATYAYPRGGETVTGPSVRLAEVLAQAWGRIQFGWNELEQRRGHSTIEAYAWDMESNTRRALVFTVKHERHTKKGVTILVDPRDIYELCANQAARRVRSCILAIIPGDIVEAAVDQCERTLTSANPGEPLGDRVRKMVAVFQGFGVTAEMVEKRLGHRLEATTEQELVTLRRIYLSIKDNMQDPSAFFDAPVAEHEDKKPKTRTESVKEALKADAPEREPGSDDDVDDKRTR